MAGDGAGKCSPRASHPDGALADRAAPAAAREKHHKRHSGAQPDGSLQGEIHFLFSFRGFGYGLMF